MNYPEYNIMLFAQAMREHGVETVFIDYHGKGDSGGIENVKIPEHFKDVSIRGIHWDTSFSSTPFIHVYKASTLLEEIASSLLASGFDNDAGGGGEITIKSDGACIHYQYFNEDGENSSQVNSYQFASGVIDEDFKKIINNLHQSMNANGLAEVEVEIYQNHTSSDSEIKGEAEDLKDFLLSKKIIDFEELSEKGHFNVCVNLKSISINRIEYITIKNESTESYPSLSFDELTNGEFCKANSLFSASLLERFELSCKEEGVYLIDKQRQEALFSIEGSHFQIVPSINPGEVSSNYSLMSEKHPLIFNESVLFSNEESAYGITLDDLGIQLFELKDKESSRYSMDCEKVILGRIPYKKIDLHVPEIELKYAAFLAKHKDYKEFEAFIHRTKLSTSELINALPENLMDLDARLKAIYEAAVIARNLTNLGSDAPDLPEAGSTRNRIARQSL